MWELLKNNHIIWTGVVWPGYRSVTCETHWWVDECSLYSSLLFTSVYVWIFHNKKGFNGPSGRRHILPISTPEDITAIFPILIIVPIFLQLYCPKLTKIKNLNEKLWEFSFWSSINLAPHLQFTNMREKRHSLMLPRNITLVQRSTCC